MSPQACTICAHPAVDEINRAILARQPKRGIARQHGVTPDAVERHARRHLPAKLSLARDASELLKAHDLIAQVLLLQRETLEILAGAQQSEDLRTALAAIAQARGNIELVSRLTIAVQDAPTASVVPYRTEVLIVLPDNRRDRAGNAVSLQDIVNRFGLYRASPNVGWWLPHTPAALSPGAHVAHDWTPCEVEEP